MAEQSEMHFEIIDSNKAKAREEQNAMREDIKQHVENCSVHDLQKINDLIKVLQK
jgi:hypothetical protein|tara:strand:+ start:580 stop:744 length:165 start_codon:yes stop_codon:yes gene_type:complete